jgi:hypothetical protein
MIKNMLIATSLLFVLVLFTGFKTDGFRTGYPLSGTDSVLNGNTQDTIYSTRFSDAAHIGITALEDLGNASFFFITTAEDTVFVNLSDNPGANISYKWVLIKP